jgi:hypothetical protein
MRKLIQSWRKRWIPFRYGQQVEGYQQIEGFLTKREASALTYVPSQLDDKATIVEIGCWKGKSTYCIAQGMKSGQKLFSIDPFNAAGSGDDTEIYAEHKGANSLLDQYQGALARTPNKSQVEPLVGYSQEFHQRFDKIDFLFIDGDHSIEGVTFDFNHYAPKIQTGGWIAFHDYRPWKETDGPTHVVDKLAKGLFKRYTLFDTLWVGVRTDKPWTA